MGLNSIMSYLIFVIKKTCRECGVILFISALVLIVQLIGILNLPYTVIYIGIIVAYILYSILRK